MNAGCTDSKQRTFLKTSQGFVSIKYGEIVEHESFDVSNPHEA